jgi:hypothetical protein
VVAPGEPQAREREEPGEVDVELAGPAQLRDVAEEDREQPEAVSGDDWHGVRGDADEDEREQDPERGHLGFLSFAGSWS